MLTLFTKKDLELTLKIIGLFLFIYPKVKDRLNTRQHGFRAKQSTVKQLLTFLRELYLIFDRNVEQVVVYLDFSKAFDSVDHLVLLSKLFHFGFDKDFVKFIKSYLSSRRQCVIWDGFLSASLPVTSCVPQGSVLKPLFLKKFSLMIWLTRLKYQKISATLTTRNCSTMATSAWSVLKMIYARCGYGLIVTVCLLIQLKAVIFILVECHWII